MSNLTHLPKTIEHCPIVEAVIEVRFTTNVPSEALFGIIYSVVKEDYKDAESLPILQLPQIIRDANKDLDWKPHYRLHKLPYLLQVGPKVISLVATAPYPGGNQFKDEALKVFQKIQGLDFIEDVKRFGIRYMNFFDSNVIDRIKLDVKIADESAPKDELYIRTAIKSEPFRSTLQISSTATNSKGNKKVKGTLIDIDTVLLKGHGDFFQQLPTLVHDSHNVTKQLFYSILTPDFLQSLNPKY